MVWCHTLTLGRNEAKMNPNGSRRVKQNSHGVNWRLQFEARGRCEVVSYMSARGTPGMTSSTNAKVQYSIQIGKHDFQLSDSASSWVMGGQCGLNHSSAAKHSAEPETWWLHLHTCYSHCSIPKANSCPLTKPQHTPYYCLPQATQGMDER